MSQRGSGYRGIVWGGIYGEGCSALAPVLLTTERRSFTRRGYHSAYLKLNLVGWPVSRLVQTFNKVGSTQCWNTYRVVKAESRSEQLDRSRQLLSPSPVPLLSSVYLSP